MNDLSQHLEIRCNPANPVMYLACCGLFDLLARMDPGARGHWRVSAPTAFLLDTSLAETDFLATLLDTFCAADRWEYRPPEPGSEPTVIQTTFDPVDRLAFSVSLDWWFETAQPSGEVDAKSAWKMYAGQQTVEKITSDMVAAGATLQKLKKLPATLTNLLACEVAMSGRFGLDPRSSRNALDVGYSSNDLGLPVNTAPFAELLAVFGLASFFPGRGGRADRFASSRGWLDKKKKSDAEPTREAGFRYVLWSRSLPIVLARPAAAQREPSPGDLLLFSVRAQRKNYSNLTLAQTVPDHFV